MIKTIIFCLLTLPLFSHATEAIAPVTPTISLNARGTIYKPADELQMNIGIVTTGATAEEALQENNRKMEAVINSLKVMGLTKKEYQTGHFSINPTYTPYPKNPPPEWKQSINGYEVNNSISIHTVMIDSAGKLIDAANKAGANSIHSVRFVLHDQRIYWNEAVSLAVANAMNDAETIAKAANLNLVRILSISLDSNNNSVVGGGTLYMAKANYETTPPIESGDVAITASVTITYEIAPNK
jgi:uncharacterized protein YggE